jgi:hypothetical protein
VIGRWSATESVVIDPVVGGGTMARQDRRFWIFVERDIKAMIWDLEIEWLRVSGEMR